MLLYNFKKNINIHMKKIFKLSSYVAFLYLLVFDLNVNQILTFNNDAVKMTNSIVVPEAVAKGEIAGLLFIR
jgi:hypothetical protein